MYSSMLHCIIGVLYFGGFLMRCCSLPLWLIGCFPLPLSGYVVWVDVEVVVVCVCGVCQNDSIVGWSAGTGYLCPWEKSLSLGEGVCVGSSFFISPTRSFHSSDTVSASVFDNSLRAFL